MPPDHAEHDSEDAASFGDEDGFGEELPQDVAAARADRFANPDLLRPLGHAHEHDVHDADAGGDAARSMLMTKAPIRTTPAIEVNALFSESLE